MNDFVIDVVRKVYRTQGGLASEIFSQFYLEFGRSEFVCLVGSSGCGKTSLLNIVAGLDTEFEGRVEVDRQDGRIAYVFQNPRLLPWRTVRENIDLALPDGTDSAYVEHLFELVGLSAALDVYPERLSLGMSRRAALVRAFAVNPTLLLLDEPFVSLDPPTARRIRALLVRLWSLRPHAALFVTHDIREAIQLADRLIFLGKNPANIVSEVRVKLPREERDEVYIERFRRELLDEYPDIRGLL